jgi:hypothetical protein
MKTMMLLHLLEGHKICGGLLPKNIRYNADRRYCFVIKSPNTFNKEDFNHPHPGVWLTKSIRTGMAIMIITLAAFIAIATADLPASFYTAMNDMDNVNMLCVKNYQGGAVFTERYTNFEHLEKDTTVVSRTVRDQSHLEANQSVLDAAINSNVIGVAHISWRSLDPRADARGRHVTLGSNVEDLTGVFSINKMIQIWSNSSIDDAGLDWIPCA